MNVSKCGCSYISLNLLHKHSYSVNKYNFLHTFANARYFPKKHSYLNIYTKIWWVLKHVPRSDTVSHSRKAAGDGAKRIVGKDFFLVPIFPILLPPGMELW